MCGDALLAALQVNHTGGLQIATPSLPHQVRALSLLVSPLSAQLVRGFHPAHVFLTVRCDRRQLMSTKALETPKKKGTSTLTEEDFLEQLLVNSRFSRNSNGI